jgi:arsenate reductase
MAEGLWRELGGTAWECHSAGSRPAGYVHPLAIRVMREIGIDISAQSSKHVDQFRNDAFDLVVTVCDTARDSCPILPSAKRTVHWPFEDPSVEAGTEDERLDAFRAVRDRIRKGISEFLSSSG